MEYALAGLAVACLVSFIFVRARSQKQKRRKQVSGSVGGSSGPSDPTIHINEN